MSHTITLQGNPVEVAGDFPSVGSQAKPFSLVAKDLSDGAYEVAKLVEVLSVYGYHTETALAAVNHLAEQLKTLF